MKHISSIILTLSLVTVLFLANGFAQDYVHYKTLTAHTGYVFSVSFSPDGTTLATSSEDKTIKLWDVATGAPLRTLIGHTGWVLSVVFNPNGRTFASGCSNGTVRLWDVATGTPLRTLTGHMYTVFSVSFSPDGLTLASGSAKETICLWNANSGTHIRTLRGHTGWVNSVAFSPDSTTLASGGGHDRTIRLWNAKTGRHLRTLAGHTDAVFSVSFSPDEQTLASGCSNGTVRLWDLKTHKHLRTLIGHTLGVHSISFSLDGKTLASGSGDKTIRLWDVATGRHLYTLFGHTDVVRSVSFAPGGKILASASGDNTIRLWKQTSPPSAKRNTSTPPKPTANQVYTNAIRAVMWIVNPGIGEGSGVLLDKKSKLAVTNAHVTGKQNTIDVYFPAPDEKGELIKDRYFYLTNGGVLKRLGYYTRAHVIARNEKTDLAIIKLDGLPETAREIDWKPTPPTTKAGELVYILGNPAKQELWRWTLGEYLNDHGDFLHIQSDIFGGNSGGPVLNKQGTLIGIVARSDQLMNAAAIPIRHINRLLSESKVKHSRMRR